MVCAGGLPPKTRDQIAAALQEKLLSPSSYAKNDISVFYGNDHGEVD
jgi:hypothetical protein